MSIKNIKHSDPVSAVAEFSLDIERMVSCVDRKVKENPDGARLYIKDALNNACELYRNLLIKIGQL
jgi:hypothetical protein